MQRTLGRSNIQVSAMGFGCWAIGGEWGGTESLGWGKVDDNESIRAIHRAIELGVTFFDTAAVYGTGHSERILGRALAQRRSQVAIATKFGILCDEATKTPIGVDVSPTSIRQQCEASLQRLKTDYIDLFQFHLNDYDPNLAGDIRETLEQLVADGKIRAYGWSTDYLDRARVFAEGKHCATIQFEMNVIDRNDEMVALCEALNLGGINRGPLAMGLLTGKYQANTTISIDDVRGPKSPTWMKYFKDGKPNQQWLAKAEAVREILASNGRTVVQGALAWLWTRSPKLIPIPGIRTVKQAEENCAAMQFGLLTNEQMQAIDRLLV